MRSTDFWSAPAAWVFRAFIGSGESFDGEALVESAPVLSLAFWAVVMLVIYALVMVLRRSWTRPGKGQKAIVAALRRMMNARAIAAAAWRAQAMHVALYLVVPLVWEAMRWIFIAALLPLFIIGFGNESISATDGTLNHLTQPACWTFVTFCEGPRSNFLHDKVQNLSGCDPVRGCPPPVATVPDLGGWGWKLVWLLGTAAWLMVWRPARAARR